MLINRVELTNCKSYEDQTVQFTPGVNAVCGRNGSGKSTILEAIGFVLFDYLPYSQAAFIREGEKTATATVRFTSSRDGREYDVTRRIGKGAAYFVTDPHLNVRLAEQKQDVSDWLSDHLGISATAEIAEVYEHAVGVPQGLLTAAFLESPARRKSIFDPLLQVDEYERAWQNLREVESWCKLKISGLDVSVARLEADVRRLAELNEKHTLLEDRRQVYLLSIIVFEKDLVGKRGDLDDLEADKNEFERLSAASTALASEMSGKALHKDRLTEEMDRIGKAEVVVSRTKDGYHAYQAAQERLQPTEESEKAANLLKILQDQRFELREKYSVAAGELETLQGQIEHIGEQAGEPSTCPLCGQALRDDKLIFRLLEEVQEKQPRLEDLADRGQALGVEIEVAEETAESGFVEARADMIMYKGDHNQYTRNVELASRSEKVASELATAINDVWECEKKLEQIEQERDALEFDSSAYGQAHQRVRELEARLAETKGRLDATETQLEEVCADMLALATSEDVLRSEQSLRWEWKATLEATGKIRSTLKEAGPHVARGLIQVISLEAQRIFGDIVQDGMMCLGWDETYDIVVEHQGSNRSMKQLSGGEQMAAALAVRLALLKEMSSVDIALFDEPTSNLDAERRELLAAQMMNVKGFQQMLVISHDSTFEVVAENVIRVAKQDGTSRVVA